MSALYAHVAFPIPVDALFTYLIPDSLSGGIAVGMRAVAPFRNRVETGYIVSLSNRCDVPLDKVKPLRHLPDTEPVIAPEMIELCRWIADYYCCSLGEAIQCTVPAGINLKHTVRYELNMEHLSEGRFNDLQRKIVGELHRKGSVTHSELKRLVGGRNADSAIDTLKKRNIIRESALETTQAVSVLMETYVRLREDAVPAPEVMESLQRRAPKQAAVLLDLMNHQPVRAATELYARHGVSSTVLAALEKNGWVERFRRELLRSPHQTQDDAAGQKLQLNSEQQAAFASITGAMDEHRFQTFLLRGITGSGKTEVYLQAIEHALRIGQSAIILVPEISLTPQTVGRFRARFQASIAVLHSGLGAGERYDEWRRAQRGDVRIVVGARSAIFAPLSNLGIVIVDEEHDSSYKQGETPRYHGRDVAIIRAKLANAVCVLGSATPSLESYHNSEQGKSVRIELTQRATQASLPLVEIVDMRIETKEVGSEVLLSRVLEHSVRESVQRGEQVMLLLNRRGFAPYVLCPQCGWVAGCDDCNVSMTYHASGGYISCHYCNARRATPTSCRECQFDTLLFLGTGTQRVEDLLMRTFEGARIARMDADTTSGKGGHAKILGRFAGGEIDILIGTQMIAKGHDFPGVTLVGVINADTGLFLPDFRAAENTFQLLTQVAGRAGRAGLVGKVIVQTFRPAHFAIQAAAQHDYVSFYAQEIDLRQKTGYPPIRRMMNFMVESEEPVHAERAVVNLFRIVRDKIRELEFKGMETIGPAPATVKRVKRKYRWNLAVLSVSAKRLNTLARAARDEWDETPRPSDVALKIDLDPYGMY